MTTLMTLPDQALSLTRVIDPDVSKNWSSYLLFTRNGQNCNASATDGRVATVVEWKEYSAHVCCKFLVHLKELREAKAIKSKLIGRSKRKKASIAIETTNSSGTTIGDARLAVLDAGGNVFQSVNIFPTDSVKFPNIEGVFSTNTPAGAKARFNSRLLAKALPEESCDVDLVMPLTQSSPAAAYSQSEYGDVTVKTLVMPCSTREEYGFVKNKLKTAKPARVMPGLSSRGGLIVERYPISDTECVGIVLFDDGESYCWKTMEINMATDAIPEWSVITHTTLAVAMEHVATKYGDRLQ